MNLPMKHHPPRWGMALAFALTIAAGAAPARGAFLATVTSTVTQESATVFRYDYTVTNLATSTLPLTDFFVDVSTAANLTTITNSLGWDVSYNPGDPDVAFNAPDPSTFLMPGAPAATFEFRSALGSGLLPDQLRSADPSTVTVTNINGLVLSAVPEPSSLALGLVGGSAVFLARRRSRRRASA